MRVWKNERGLTLTESMAAVVIMGIVAVPLTSLGTTFLHSYQTDQRLHEAVLLAERVMLAAKSEVERTGTVSEEGRSGQDGELVWAVVSSEFKQQDEPIEGLTALEVTVTFKDALNPEEQGEHTLEAVARTRVQR